MAAKAGGSQDTVEFTMACPTAARILRGRRLAEVDVQYDVAWAMPKSTWDTYTTTTDKKATAGAFTTAFATKVQEDIAAGTAGAEWTAAYQNVTFGVKAPETVTTSDSVVTTTVAPTTAAPAASDESSAVKIGGSMGVGAALMTLVMLF